MGAFFKNLRFGSTILFCGRKAEASHHCIRTLRASSVRRQDDTEPPPAPPPEYKYHVSSIVSPQWLVREMASGNVPLKILDCSWHRSTDRRNPREEFLQMHIPDARFFDIDECIDKNSEYTRMAPSGEEFEEYVGNLGIDNDSHVVVYENNERDGLFSSPRVWWMFRLFGHRLVSVLDGGMPRWRQLQYPTAGGPGRVKPATFTATYNRSLVATFEDVETIMEESDFPILDTRSRKSFNGCEFDPTHHSGALPGHIAGAINLPSSEFVDSESNSLKDSQELFKVFRKHDINIAYPFLPICNSGVTACIAALAAHMCGAPDVPVYDGSWSEWSKRAKKEHVAVESSTGEND